MAVDHRVAVRADDGEIRQPRLAGLIRLRERAKVVNLSVTFPRFAIGACKVESAAGYFAGEVPRAAQRVSELRVAKMRLPRAMHDHPAAQLSLKPSEFFCRGEVGFCRLPTMPTRCCQRSRIAWYNWPGIMLPEAIGIQRASYLATPVLSLRGGSCPTGKKSSRLN
jgi:hypothetical protein